MKISIIIPTKDGGECFQQLLLSLKNNVEYLISKDNSVEYAIIFSINGDPIKPLSYLTKCKDIIDFSYIICPYLGKISAIQYALEGLNGETTLILDDDVVFEQHLIYKAIQGLKNDHIVLISYQTKALPYEGTNFIKRIMYDIINVRSLYSLYKGSDPFLFGRFLALKGNIFPVPNESILEDIYLSIIYDECYVIYPEYIYYNGLDSLVAHVKRVIVFETYRNNLRAMFPGVYERIMIKNKRIIDYQKLNMLGLYVKFCFFMYNILRFVTNNIIARFFTHKKHYW